MSFPTSSTDPIMTTGQNAPGNIVAKPITEQNIATPDMDRADNNVRYAINIVIFNYNTNRDLLLLIKLVI